MEKWNEILLGKIPKDDYEIQLINGEERGLVITLESKKNRIIFDFGVVLAIRMLDEGIIQEGCYSDRELAKYRPERFKNVIYKLHEGEFEKQIENFASGYWEVLSPKHYVIITQNYNIDIITEYEPEVTVEAQKTGDGFHDPKLKKGNNNQGPVKNCTR